MRWREVRSRRTSSPPISCMSLLCKAFYPQECRCPNLGHQMTYGTHLRRSRHGTLYFRNVIPSDVRGSAGKSELSISLGTASKRGAELAALELELVAKRFVEGAREAIRTNEPVKSNLAALHAVMRVRQYEHVVGELNEADLVIADQRTQIETLTAKLISRLDVPRAEPVSVADPTLVAAVQAFKAERQATGKWAVKTAEMQGSRLRLLLGHMRSGGVLPAPWADGFRRRPPRRGALRRQGRVCSESRPLHRSGAAPPLLSAADTRGFHLLHRRSRPAAVRDRRRPKSNP